MSKFRRNLLYYQNNDIPPASSYVQQDLIFQLDGLEKGNITGAWTDLKNGYTFTGNAIELSNGWDFNGSQYLASQSAGVSQLNSNHIYTIEIIMHMKNPSSWGMIITTSWNYSSRAKHFQATYGISNGVNHLKNGSSGIHDKKNLNCCIIQSNADITYSAYCNSTTCIYNKAVTGTQIIPTSTLGGHDNNQTVIGSRYSSSSGYSAFALMTLYSIRLYNRELTQAEMIYNQQIDINRYKLNIQ